MLTTAQDSNFVNPKQVCQSLHYSSVQIGRLELNKHIGTAVLKCQSLIYITEVLNNY